MKLEGVPVLCNGHINPGLATGDTDISFDFSKKVIEDFQKDKAENLVAAKQTVGVEYTAPDGGWGWVIAIAAFATWFLVGLTAYNFGMLYSEFLLEMGTSTTFISWIYCLGLVISSIISAFVDPLVVAFGWRKVAVVMGAIYSFALIVSAFATSSIFLLFSSLVAGSMVDTLYNIVSSIIPHYFIRWRDLVNTIMVLGTSVNLLVVPYLLVYLHAEYGFRGAIFIIGGLSLNMVPAGMVLYPVEWPSKNTIPVTTTRESLDTASMNNSIKAMLKSMENIILLFKSVKVIIIALSYGIFFSATAFTSSYVPFVMQATGYTLNESAHCLTMVGVFHLVTRFIHPFISVICHGDNFHVLTASYAAIPISIVVFSCVNIFHVKAAAMAVLGSGMSFASAAFIPVIVDIFGLPLVLPVLCVTGIFEAIGFLTIGPITGAVRDLSGSYTFSLYVSSACIFSFSFLPCMCLWAVNAYNQRQQHKLLQEKASGKSKEEIYH
ncbi:monocarboxylate transporter 13-like isoform X1 [Scylla paramamosain]|uniref:monocarboxylate transporter 13-like isoform X1 n=1 Tax=Scylla paramamosain TaxID=85552 RepID=UPI0030830C5B